MAMVSIEGISLTVNAYRIMTGLFTSGWTANHVQKYMTGIGQGHRRSTVQLVRRFTLDLVKKEKLVRTLKPTQRPTKGHLIEMDWDRHYRYRVFGEWQLLNADTGEYTTQQWSLYADEIPTKQQIEQKLADQFLIGETDPEGLIQNIVTKQYMHKRGSSY